MRKRAIFPTGTGRKAILTCRDAMHQVEERMLAPLSAAKRKTLNRLLADCIAGLNEQAAGTKKARRLSPFFLRHSSLNS